MPRGIISTAWAPLPFVPTSKDHLIMPDTFAAPATRRITFAAYASLALCLAAPGAAQDLTEQPLISDPYTVADARAAMDEIMARDDEAEAENIRRFSAFEGPMDEFVSSQPIYQDVTWAYGPCTDLVSLIPPPAEGWAIYSAFGRVENPVQDTRAELFYHFYDHGIAPGEPGFSDPSNTVVISITDSPESAEFNTMAVNNEAMRSAMFDAGPYGYPVMRMTPGSVQLGPYGVAVSGNDPQHVDLYLTRIIGCAIENGLIAEGVDPATLSDTP